MLVLLSASARADVTLESLLQEMVDFNAVARWPQPEFTCRQASSYDRATVALDNTPFCGEPRLDQAMTQGHNTSTRTRNLDGIPFRRSPK